MEDTDRLFRFDTGLTSGFTNGILRTTVAPAEVDDVLVGTRTWFPAGRAWHWIVGATSMPPDLVDRLEAVGLERVRPSMPAMAVELASLELERRRPAGAAITEVASADDVDAWIRVRQTNHPMDDATVRAWHRTHDEAPFTPAADLRLFVGHLSGRAVAAAAVYLDTRTDIAGIYAVDVVPDARGRGFGTAVTGAALLAARERGYPVAVLTATPLGQLLYERMGFRIVGDVTVFVGPPGRAGA